MLTMLVAFAAAGNGLLALALFGAYGVGATRNAELLDLAKHAAAVAVLAATATAVLTHSYFL